MKSLLKQRVRLTREGWYYLFVLAFVLVGAVLREINLMLVLAGMMVGLLVFNALGVLLRLRGLRIERHTLEQVSAGDTVTVELSVRAPRPAWGIRLEDQVALPQSAASDARATASVLIPHVPAAAAACASYRLKLARRGRYRLGPLRISTRYPLGLVARTVELAQFDELVVVPRLGRLNRGWAQLHETSHLGSVRAQRRQGILEGEFYGLRDWRQGDSQRWVHWRTSARRGNLVVRQFERPRTEDLAVFVELWAPPRPDADQLDHVELAVSFAATVASQICRRGNGQLRLAVAGREPASLAGAASSALGRDLAELLADAQADPNPRQLPELLARELDALPATAQAVLVSTRPVRLDEPRFATLHQGARRRALLARMQCLDVSDPAFAEYFIVD